MRYESADSKWVERGSWWSGYSYILLSGNGRRYGTVIRDGDGLWHARNDRGKAGVFATAQDAKDALDSWLSDDEL